MWPRIDGLRVLELGLPGKQRQWLNDLVLRDEKKATAGRLADYKAEGEELEQVGEQLVLVDDELQRLALVEVDRVEVMPFGTVPWEFAAAENEGDTSIEEWREGHRHYWREAEDAEVGDDELVVLVWLHLVLSSDEFSLSQRSTRQAAMREDQGCQDG